LRSFADDGFEATTVEAIAAAAEVSPRTFFRYFATKEDVLFDDGSEGSRRGELVVAALRAHQGGAAPGVMLRDAFDSIAPRYESELPLLLLQHRIIAATPSLQNRAIRRRHVWEAAVVEELSRRFGTEADVVLSLRVTVAATTAALHVALDTWVDSGGHRDLDGLLTRVWQQLIDGVDCPLPGTESRAGKHAKERLR
jgi:AcrR family transcriptional regulator